MPPKSGNTRGAREKTGAAVRLGSTALATTASAAKQQPQSVPATGQLLPTGVAAFWHLQREERLRGSDQRFSCLLERSSGPQWRHGKPRQFCAHFCALNHQEHRKRLPR